MTPVTVVGMIAGGLLILTAIAVFWSKKEFPAGGVGVTVVGLVLIGMSQWSQISLKAAGVELSALAEVAKASAELGDEVNKLASSVSTTKAQLSVVARQLEDRNVLTPAVTGSIRGALESAPRVDTAQVRATSARLREIQTRPVRPPDGK